LRDLGAMARSQNLRLSFHPSQYIILNSVDAKLTAQSVHDIKSQAEMPDCMELGPEAVVVVRNAHEFPFAAKRRRHLW
jgi:UV DNA damage endonuclease